MRQAPLRDVLAAAIAREAWQLATARLELLPLGREHAPVMFPVLADADLYEHTGGRPPATVEALAEHYRWWEARWSPDRSELWLNWVVRTRADGEAIGYVQATVGADHAGLAWVIGVPWQRQGYAVEAALAMADWLAKHGVSDRRACIKPEHRASQRVAERLGMRCTAEWIDGEEVWTTAPA